MVFFSQAVPICPSFVPVEAKSRGFRDKFGEHSGDHNHQDFLKSTVGGVLQHKWEAYCDTNGRSTDNISLSSEHRGTKSTAIQIGGGVLQYKLGVYCDIF